MTSTENIRAAIRVAVPELNTYDYPYSYLTTPACVVEYGGFKDNDTFASDASTSRTKITLLVQRRAEQEAQAQLDGFLKSGGPLIRAVHSIDGMMNIQPDYYGEIEIGAYRYFGTILIAESNA